MKFDNTVAVSDSMGRRALLSLAVLTALSWGCAKSQPTPPVAAAAPAALPAVDPPAKPRKVGVVLVSHGSRSETWRNALLDLEKRTSPALLATEKVSAVRTAFMEYTEPSIATQLRKLDEEGYTDVVMVPVFLTVSPHSFDDIPTIIGQKTDPKSLDTLKMEKIERYTPTAKVHLTPLLDFGGLLRSNIVRRAKALSTDPTNEGLVLIAYGDETYEKDWVTLLDGVAAHVAEKTGITAHSHGWCGHIAHYDPAHTTRAIEEVLKTKKKALVIPVLVAHDEMFQVKIIGDGIAKVAQPETRVAYRPDSLLPDPDLDAWVVRAVAESVAALKLATVAGSR